MTNRILSPIFALRTALFAVAIAFTALMGTSPAMAQDRAGVYIGPDNFGIYLDNDARRDYRGNRPHDRYGDWYADPNRYRPYNRARWTDRDCYPVSRRAYDRRGRVVINSATMCYDRNGRTFVVPGSRRTTFR